MNCLFCDLAALFVPLLTEESKSLTRVARFQQNAQLHFTKPETISNNSGKNIFCIKKQGHCGAQHFWYTDIRYTNPLFTLLVFAVYLTIDILLYCIYTLSVLFSRFNSNLLKDMILSAVAILSTALPPPLKIFIDRVWHGEIIILWSFGPGFKHPEWWSSQ